METYESSELGGVGEGVLGVWHGWRNMAAAPAQDLLGNKFPSQVCLSSEGRESFALQPRNHPKRLRPLAHEAVV